jgi:tRNA A-37 threonylcarbamoyl transferase component Bud32
MDYVSTDLVEFGRNIPIPCNVTLLTDGVENRLEILEILRILPGKRLTAVARLNGNKTVAKLFFHPTAWKRKLNKELSGMEEFEKNKLPTPKILSQHSIKGAGGVIIIEYLETGISLAEYFADEEAVSSPDGERIWSLIFSAVCSCHNTGLWQGDMHLGNYMLFKDQLYLIDGGDVKRLVKPLGKSQRLENIADFISQFPVSFDAQIDLMLESYQVDYGEFCSADLAKVQPMVQSLRMQRLSHFEKKVFRSTSANVKVRTAKSLLVHDRLLDENDLLQFLKNPDSYITQEGMLKDGDTTTVAVANIGGIPMVLKRYNIVSPGQALRRLLDESRAHRCWRNSSMLDLLGICTPHAYLFLEERLSWFFGRRSYLLTEKIAANNLILQLEGADGVINDVAVSSSSNSTANEAINKTKLVAAFANLFEIMHRYQISHGDMKATNFIFLNDRLYVLDLDGMRRHPFKWWSHRKSLQDMKRFERNWTGSRYEQLFAPMINQYYENRRASNRG